ncbi:MAG: pilus assembly FimT family protein [Roseimicrobium sp.]
MRGSPQNYLARVGRRHGLTLSEAIISIAVISVLSAIAIPNVLSTFSPSQEIIARNTVETLNTAVHKFNLSNYELLFTAVGPSGQDELLILRTLQYRNPDVDDAGTGSPYMRVDWNPTISNKTTDYRVVWGGSLFKLAKPGQSGTGLKVAFDGSDLGTPYVFPPGFTSAGK